MVGGEEPVERILGAIELRRARPPSPESPARMPLQKSRSTTAWLSNTQDSICLHDLRHTFGTQCAAKGIDLRRIQAWMGHANIATTMRYLHYYVPQHDDAARLTAAFGTARYEASTACSTV